MKNILNYIQSSNCNNTPFSKKTYFSGSPVFKNVVQPCRLSSSYPWGPPYCIRGDRHRGHFGSWDQLIPAGLYLRAILWWLFWAVGHNGILMSLGTKLDLKSLSKPVDISSAGTENIKGKTSIQY